MHGFLVRRRGVTQNASLLTQKNLAKTRPQVCEFLRPTAHTSSKRPVGRMLKRPAIRMDEAHANLPHRHNRRPPNRVSRWTQPGASSLGGGASAPGLRLKTPEDSRVPFRQGGGCGTAAPTEEDAICGCGPTYSRPRDGSAGSAAHPPRHPSRSTDQADSSENRSQSNPTPAAAIDPGDPHPVICAFRAPERVPTPLPLGSDSTEGTRGNIAFL